MSYEFYKVIHVIAILILFMAFGGLAASSQSGPEGGGPLKKYFAMLHGIALLLLFVAGFGLQAKMGGEGGRWPVWLIVKIGLWVLLGGAPVLLRKTPHLAKVWFVVLPLVGGLAGFLAVVKPG